MENEERDVEARNSQHSLNRSFEKDNGQLKEMISPGIETLLSKKPNATNSLPGSPVNQGVDLARSNDVVSPRSVETPAIVAN